jgi:hypothetical protein
MARGLAQAGAELMIVGTHPSCQNRNSSSTDAMAPCRIWNCKIHVRSCKSAPSAVNLFAGSDIIAAQQDNVGRYDVMKGSKTIYNEMVDIISRYASDDGEHTTSIDGLIFGRRTSPIGVRCRINQRLSRQKPRHCSNWQLNLPKSVAVMASSRGPTSGHPALTVRSLE